MSIFDRFPNDLIVDPDVTLPVVPPVGEEPDASVLPAILIGIGVAVLAALAVFMIVTYTKRKNRSKDKTQEAE